MEFRGYIVEEKTGTEILVFLNKKKLLYQEKNDKKNSNVFFFLFLMSAIKKNITFHCNSTVRSETSVLDFYFSVELFKLFFFLHNYRCQKTDVKFLK